jgi:type IV secretory pathway TrbL component
MFSNRTTGRRVSSAAAAIVAAAVLVAGATAPAYAADPTSDTPAKASAKASKERRYCVKPQTTTGTIFNAKTCMTREQWIAKTGVDPAAPEQK